MLYRNAKTFVAVKENFLYSRVDFLYFCTRKDVVEHGVGGTFLLVTVKKCHASLLLKKFQMSLYDEDFFENVNVSYQCSFSRCIYILQLKQSTSPLGY